MAAKALKLAGLGFLMGMAMGVFILVAIGLANGGTLSYPEPLLAITGSEAGALLAHTLLSGVYGAIPMAGVVLYELDSWGLLKQAVVHYLSYTVAFMVIGVLAGWISPSPADIGIVAGIFMVGHAIIWFVMFTRYKKETEQLNVLLEKAKQVS